MTKTSIRIVCIGAGYFAGFHVEAWKRLEGVELLAICDENKEKAQEMADKYGVSKVYTNYQEMISKEKPDVVDIITPPQTHLEICSFVASEGIDMICQKPLAPNLAESRELLKRVGERQVRFMVHENFRFQPWFREIKKQIDLGSLGDSLHLINFQMRTGDGWQSDAYMNRQPYFRKMPRLLIYETGIHYIDVFGYLGGKITEVYAKLKRWNGAIAGEDCAMVHFEFEQGTMGILDANRYNESSAEDPRFTFGTCLIEGNKGSIHLQHDGSLHLKPLGKSPILLNYPMPKKNFAGDCVYATQQHFLEAYRNDLAFETEGPAYLKSLIVQEAVYESSRLGQAISVKYR